MFGSYDENRYMLVVHDKELDMPSISTDITGALPGYFGRRSVYVSFPFVSFQSK